MKADSLKIFKVFSSGGVVHYILPYFQREYAWEKSHWQTLLNDVLGLYETYNPDKEPEHFMGALVVINDGTRNGVIPAFKLVDGQQRLITISLMLWALGQLIEHSHSAIYKRIQGLLINPEESGLLYFKLLPTTKYGDREAYLALLKREALPAQTDSKIPESFHYFHKEFETRLKAGSLDPERLFLILVNCLQVVFIDLDQDERPYKIFESLNAKGKPLTQADLVRNYIAMKLPEARQGEIFEKYWSKIEAMLQEKRTVGRSRLGELTAFLRHYLAMRSGTLCNEAHVYERFRDRVEAEFSTPQTFEQEIATLKRFAEHYDRFLRPEHEQDNDIQTVLRRLNTLEISTAYPFLLAAYDHMAQSGMGKNDLCEVLRVLENFMVRRYIVGEPTNYLNKMFPTLWREISPARVVDTLTKVIVTKNYPADHRVQQAMLTEQIFDKRSQTREKIVIILESINRRLSAMSGGYTVLDNPPTIEHIMPQTLSDVWKEELGSDWERTYTDFLNTLGNLTLVTQEWNSSLSNAPFTTKKQKILTHALRLNSDYFNRTIDRWDEGAIRTRAEFLTARIFEIWPQLGTVPVQKNVSGTKPKTLIVLGEAFSVSSWRDVAFQTAKSVAEIVDDFNKIAEQMPAYFDKEKFRSACRQLPNGWWLYMNLSAASIKSFCRNLIALAGLTEEDWQVEEE